MCFNHQSMITNLAKKFREQQDFSEAYSPLYAHLFGTVADWLEADGAEADPLVAWLLETGAERRPIEVSLLLMAGLHRGVNAGILPHLAPYYPTHTPPQTPPQFPRADIVRDAIWQTRHDLTPFIQTATVQTNETGRGLVWLLPLHFTGWAAVHLVDLGASAGLNLFADFRHYELISDDGEQLTMGRGNAPQFTSKIKGKLLGLPHELPAISSRLGGDLNPFHLHNREDELNLSSFVWADHGARWARLQEAIAVKRNFEGDFRLETLDLPTGLGDFLRLHVPQDNTPVVLYNTVMSLYLSDRGASLHERIGAWAGTQERPVLWLQWEISEEAENAGKSWTAWTADLWQNGETFHELLGYTHPHGTEICFVKNFAKGAVFDRIRKT
jgi:hypothetical protein